MAHDSIAVGIHAISALLAHRPSAIERIYCAHSRRHDHRVASVMAKARASSVPCEWVDTKMIAKQLQGYDAHQGIFAVCRHQMQPLNSLWSPAIQDGSWLGLACDQVQDPHNLGALLRTGACAGLDGVILPKHASAPLNATVGKVASGAMECLAISVVTNLVRALHLAKEQGIWVIGTDERATQTLYDIDVKKPICLVMGGEAKGLRPLVRQACDELVAIPSVSRFQSLNVSVACGVCLFEIQRARGQMVRDSSGHSVR